MAIYQIAYTMFRKTDPHTQLDIFSSTAALLSEREAKYYNDEKAWFNQFFKGITSRVDEEMFAVLFKSSTVGAPSSSVRVQVALCLMKEILGCSDEEMMDKCRFDLLYRKALGLVNLKQPIPAVDTLKDFRKRCCELAETSGEMNLVQAAYIQAMGRRSRVFRVTGKSVRIDCRLIGSNMVWTGRYEYVFRVLRQFADSPTAKNLTKQLRTQLDDYLKACAVMAVNRTTNYDMRLRFQEMGELIYKILLKLKDSDNLQLSRIFTENYLIYIEKGKRRKQVLPREKRLTASAQ